MIIKTLWHLYHKLKYLKKTFNKYKQSLAPGSYFLHPCMRAIVLQDEYFRTKLDVYFAQMPYYSGGQLTVKYINKYGILKNKKNAGSEYQAMYIANNSEKVREIKLFSISKQKILTICTCEEEWKRQIYLYSLLHEAYHLPKITTAEEYENSYFVDMVDLLPIPNNKSAIVEIADSTKKFNSANLQKKINEVLTYKYEDNRFETILDQISGQISPEVMNDNITLCMQHGDLSSENLIYGESNHRVGYWWIDWEHVKERVFYYDVFFYIQHSAFYCNNDIILEEFLSGNFDSILSDLFLHFGHTYIPERRKEYFCVFIIVFLMERICDKGYFEALKKYFNFMIRKGIIVNGKSPTFFP